MTKLEKDIQHVLHSALDYWGMQYQWRIRYVSVNKKDKTLGVLFDYLGNNPFDPEIEDAKYNEWRDAAQWELHHKVVGGINGLSDIHFPIIWYTMKEGLPITKRMCDTCR